GDAHRLCVAFGKDHAGSTQNCLLPGVVLWIAISATNETNETDSASLPGGPRPRLFNCSRNRRCWIGMRAITKHDVKQDDSDRRVGGLLQEALVAQGLVDHGMWSAAGEFVVPEIHDRVPDRLPNVFQMELRIDRGV